MKQQHKNLLMALIITLIVIAAINNISNEYEVHLRAKDFAGKDKQVILDVNELAKEHLVIVATNPCNSNCVLVKTGKPAIA